MMKDVVTGGIGYIWTFFSKIFIALIQIIQILIFTRFLSTTELGYIAILMIVVNFSLIFMDIGISNAIIQKKSISKKQLSSLYWLNIISGFFVFILVFFASSYIADFYNASQLLRPIQVLSISFIVVSFGNQFKLLKRKNLAFKFISITEICSALISFFLGIFLILNNYGIFSFVYSFLLNQTIISAVFLLDGLKKYRPQIFFNFNSISNFISFGLYQMGQNSIVYFNNQLDSLLIGKLLGLEVLGIYSVIKQLVMRPSQIINPVVSTVSFPIMSKLQDNLDTLRKYYLSNLGIICSINFFIYSIFIFTSTKILQLLLGDSWIIHSNIFVILSIYASLRSTTSPAGPLLLSRGRADIGFVWSIFELIFFTTTILLSINYHLVGIAYGLLIFQLLYLLPNWYFIVNKMCDATIKEYFRVQIIPFCLSILSILPTALFLTDFIENQIISFLSIVFFGLINYIFISYHFNRQLTDTLKGSFIK